MIPQAAITQLTRSLDGCSGRLRAAKVEVDVDPLQLVRAGAASYGWAAYFAHEDFSVGALGVAHRSAAAGPGRFDALSSAFSRLPSGLVGLVGFSFGDDGPRDALWEGFPAATSVVPRMAVVSRAGRCTLQVVLRNGAGTRRLADEMAMLRVPGPVRLVGAADRALRSRPAPGEWRRTVGEAVAAINAASLSKVVLARSVDVIAAASPAPFDIASQLHLAHPRSYVYGWQEGNSVLVGASPELLLRRSGRTVLSRPMAGSAPRGDSEEGDRAIGDRLMGSSKDLSEHRFVVDDIVARLRMFTDRLEAPPHPELVRLATVQHLATQIVGRLADDMSLLEVLGVLHPTPAVGGTPRTEAASFIEKLEAVDRGWYSGGIGWSDTGGDGEVAVALRCALMSGEVSRLYAGAGIVAESDPDAELAETRLKLAPLLSVLAAG